jgi:hypothetical protein
MATSTLSEKVDGADASSSSAICFFILERYTSASSTGRSRAVTAPYDVAADPEKLRYRKVIRLLEQEQYALNTLKQPRAKWDPPNLIH